MPISRQPASGCFTTIPLCLLVLLVSSCPLLALEAGDLHTLTQMIERGELKQAESRLWTAVRRDPNDAQAIRLLGKIRLRQQRYQEAEALLRRALALQPRLLEAHCDLGEMYARQGKDEEALTNYLEALKLDPAGADANAGAAALYQKAGKFRESLAAASKVPQAKRPGYLLPVLAADYLELGEIEQVRPLFQQMLQVGPKNPNLAAEFGNVLLAHGLLGDAERLAATAMSRPRPTASWLVFGARVQEQKGQRARARESLVQALRLSPNSADVLAEAGRLAALDHDWKRAATMLQGAVQRDPKQAAVLQGLVVALLHVGEKDDAIAAARQLSALRPDDPESLNLLAGALIESREWQQARPAAERLLSLRPDDAKAQLMLAIVQFNQNDYAGARQSLEKCLQQDRKESEAHYYLGLIARQQGDLPAATAALEQTITLNPKHAAAHALLGALYVQQGNLARAQRALEQSVALAPESAQNHYQLALVYKRMGLSAKARQQMDISNKLRRSSQPNPAQTGPGTGQADAQRP